MRRLVVCCGMLLLSALQVGCYAPLMNRITCQGCGDLYAGAYADNPPGCEPCDRCGNYTGCDPCASRYPWSRARMFQSLSSSLKSCNSKCCDGQCGNGQCGGGGGFNLFGSLGGNKSCTDPGCGVPDPGCGLPEPGCGVPEPGCGDTGSGNSMPTNGTIIEQDVGPEVPAARRPSTMQQVSRSTVVVATGSRSPQRCNCGKQH